MIHGSTRRRRARRRPRGRRPRRSPGPSGACGRPRSSRWSTSGRSETIATSSRAHHGPADRAISRRASTCASRAVAAARAAPDEAAEDVPRRGEHRRSAASHWPGCIACTASRRPVSECSDLPGDASRCASAKIARARSAPTSVDEPRPGRPEDAAPPRRPQRDRGAPTELRRPARERERRSGRAAATRPSRRTRAGGRARRPGRRSLDAAGRRRDPVADACVASAASSRRARCRTGRRAR